ncbi:MAG: 3'(2'),5'-bisphosphate nucleotidase CysQ [Magnetococcales bacterium]|nr:3'(2'),5'-bisphosphate nucleotidase CysQ [Magnetococcales bacterium]
MFSLQSDLALMEEAARMAGSCIMRYFQPGAEVSNHVHLKDKSRNNPLTKADVEADQLLRQELLGHRPDYGWLSEETADDASRLSRQRVWIVDPMDGTKEFMRGIPRFAVSIGLVEAGRPIAACIHNPATHEFFSATLDGGARLNGQRIQVSPQDRLCGASCLASHSETKRGEWEPFKTTFHITPMGSIAYKLALVAAGRFDLTFTLTPKNEWDFCAGTLLLHEAGGRVSHKDGQPCRFNQKNTKVRSVLATNGRLHEALLALLEPTPLSPDRQAVA